ncbi:MAG: xanthine dehydrogenase small subunit [Rubrivivax sp.]
MSQRPIRFVHRGAVVEVDGLPLTTTVLAWLREQARRTGTKEACNEGDCGACAVLVGELDADADGPTRLRWRPFNACLMFVAALDGKALRTVEDLPADHPAPLAMVTHHGSQCGFCTPGFVISLAALHDRHHKDLTRPTRREIADALAGNLCRCTGYRPILDAGEAMFDAPPSAAPADDDATRTALHRLRADPPLEYAALQPATGAVERWSAPRTLDALATAAAAQPDATLISGATDIALWVNKQQRVLPALIHVGAVPELRRIERADGVLRIGAAAPLEDAWAALTEQLPPLREMFLRFGSPLVRHAGTLGGNLVNGSPIGDGAPVLMALGTTLLLRHGAVERTLALDHFYVDYLKNRRAPGELLVRIDVPLPGAATTLRAYKLAKRYDSDISALACGLVLVRDLADALAPVRDVRLVFGGLAATVRHAAQAEAAVRGQPWSEATLRAAQAALAQDFQPLSDHRGSAAYRLRSARALLERFWLETRASDPLPAAMASVWHAAAGAPAA